jgi:hypothetical protein
MSRLWSIEFRPGAPLRAGQVTLTPFSRALVVRLPGASGGLIWNRPVSVLAQYTNGEQVIPVPDVYLRTLLTLFGACLGFAGLASLVARARPRRQLRIGR